MGNRWSPGCLSLFLVLAGGATAQPNIESFGVVALTREQRPCVTFAAAASSGERVQVILLPSKQRVQGTVSNAIRECGVHQEPGYAYELQLGQPVDYAYGSIAARGTVPPTISFRQCSGSEALHLSAWQNGHRIWHGSYYLGYEVVPDCRPEEVD